MAQEEKQEQNQTILWTQKAKKLLLGRQIVRVGYMTTETAEELRINERGVFFVLDNGDSVFVMSDDEGNSSGALHIATSEQLEILPTLRMEY